MYSLLKPYEAIVDFLGEALGDNVEIALHDLTSPEQEVVALANGHISGRTVGAKLSNLSIHYLETKQYLNNDYVVNYKTVCINVNISDLEYIQTTLYKILGIKETTKVEFKRDNPIEILSSPLDEMVDKYIKECLTEMGIPSYVLVERLKVDEKIRVVKYLQAKGTFKVKGAIALVAEKLDVSEPTIYRYLKKM